MKLCTDCRWYKYDKLFQFKNDTEMEHICMHPNVRSPVIGESTFAKAESIRGNHKSCGREGRWWERKQTNYPAPEYA